MFAWLQLVMNIIINCILWKPLAKYKHQEFISFWVKNQEFVSKEYIVCTDNNSNSHVGGQQVPMWTSCGSSGPLVVVVGTYMGTCWCRVSHGLPV